MSISLLSTSNFCNLEDVNQNNSMLPIIDMLVEHGTFKGEKVNFFLDENQIRAYFNGEEIDCIDGLSQFKKIFNANVAQELLKNMCINRLIVFEGHTELKLSTYLLACI